MIIDTMLAASIEAAEVILEIYGTAFSAEAKADGSPVTEADGRAEAVILEHLRPLGLPVLAEESVSAGDVPVLGSRFFVVDPLDGTKEFLKRNGEFTVNIALIDNGVPVLGAVYAPAMDWLLVGGQGLGTRWQQGTQSGIARVAGAPNPLRVAASRSHRDEITQAYLDRIGSVDTVGLGSSLKFCKIATGEVDLYPRFGPTSEWDTAAAQAVLEAAGGGVFTLDGAPLRYNSKESLLNPHFIAVGDLSIGWQDWL